jgi:hypothetical protein
MRKRVGVLLALVLACCLGADAQQMQPITVVSDYYAKPGREADFMELIRTIGGPVRDKLMSEGVITAWGVDVPYFRMPGAPTHTIWYDVAGWDGVEKVQAAMAARFAQLDEDDRKAAEEARKKNAKPGKTFRERVDEILDQGKSRDWVLRNLYLNMGSALPAAGAQPFSRLYSILVKPGMAQEWRTAFDSYIKPTLDKLTESGAISAWALGVEEVKTAGEFTHYVWVLYPNLAGIEKQRNAFGAVTAARPSELNEHINHVFTKTSDPNASRSYIVRGVIFKMAPQR